MFTRREFLRTGGALGGVVALGGPSLLSGRQGHTNQTRSGGLAGQVTGTTHLSPTTIANDGTTNVSQALTDWIASTGQPGDTFKLRRGAAFAPGVYWIPQGVRIGKPCTLDLNGCWLYTGLELGADDPGAHTTSRDEYPPLWDDWGEQSHFNDTHPTHGFWTYWPRQRCNIAIVSSDVNVMSSLGHARIQGAARTVNYRSPGILGRQAPTGCEFEGALESQHGIRIGGHHGAYSDTHSYQNIDIDLSNISIEFVHGDGVYLGDNHRDIRIHGMVQPESVIGGTVINTSTILGYDGQGGDVVEGATLAEDRWQPWLLPLAGIHHTGRQGIATDYRNADTTIEDLSIWRTGHGAIDLEPGTCSALIEGMVIRRISTGIITLRTIPMGGPRKIRDLHVLDTVHYELPRFDCRKTTATDFHENLRFENVRVGNGVRGKPGIPVWTLDRVLGLGIYNCEIPVRPGGIGVELTGPTYATGADDCKPYLTASGSAWVNVDPPLADQFPEVGP
jgi:hypothetical protein